jgi:hypothetical protein
VSHEGPRHISRNAGNASSSFPSPCTDGSFAAPVYQVLNATLETIFGGDEGYTPREERLNFRLEDVANNYGLNCTWGPVDDTYDIFWYFSSCVADNGADLDVFTNRIMFLSDESPNEPLSLNVSQVWICEQANGSYPCVLRAILIRIRPRLMNPWLALFTKRPHSFLTAPRVPGPRTATIPTKA